jgi:lipoate-protein ligase A
VTLEIGSYDRDEDLIAATLADGEPRLRVYPHPGTAVVLGRGSKPGVELEVPACVADGVPVLRRRGGGCAVVLDPGNVIVSVTLPVAGIGDNHRHFERISDWLVAGLGRRGVQGLRRDGISDLARGDRKVGGACIYRARGLLFYTASLLVSPEVALMERYLRHPPREPGYRRGRGHADFVDALGRERGDARRLAAELASVLDVAALT